MSDLPLTQEQEHYLLEKLLPHSVAEGWIPGLRATLEGLRTQLADEKARADFAEAQRDAELQGHVEARDTIREMRVSFAVETARADAAEAKLAEWQAEAESRACRCISAPAPDPRDATIQWLRDAAVAAMAHRKRAETDGAARISYEYNASRYLDGLLAILTAVQAPSEPKEKI